MDINGRLGTAPRQKTFLPYREPVLVDAKTTKTNVHRLTLKKYLAENLVVGVIVALLVLSDLAFLGLLDADLGTGIGSTAGVTNSESVGLADGANWFVSGSIGICGVDDQPRSVQAQQEPARIGKCLKEITEKTIHEIT